MKGSSQLIAAAVLALALSACGGGGGGGGTAASSAPAPAPTVTLTTSASDAALNAAVTLTWSSTNATSCTASGGWSGTRSASGSASVTVAATQAQSYALSCTGTGGSGSASVQVTGWTAPTVTVSADETDLLAGNTANVTWSSTNAVSCAGSNGLAPSAGLAGSLTTPVLNATTTYTLTCTNPAFAGVAGQVVVNVSATVTLAVTLQYQAPGAPVITTFSNGTRAYVPDWANPVTAVVPYAYVELADASGNLLQAGTFANASGVASFAGVASTGTATPRFQARMSYPTLGLDIQVLDNTATPISTAVTTVRGRYPVYSTSAAAFTPAGRRAHQAVTVTLPDGWDATSASLVDANRIAGPYEVLAVATQEALVMSRAIGGTPTWNKLSILWSTVNKGGKSAPPDNYDQGFVTGSGGFYASGHGTIDATGALSTTTNVSEDHIFLSGDPTYEAMEIYPFIMSHEMGHFVQRQFSRSANPGGPHAYSDNEDPRLAWGEGSASGIAALVMGTPQERRVFTSGGNLIVSIVDILHNTNNGNPQTWPVGWYQESTVAGLMWTLQDPAGGFGLAPETVLAAMLSTTWNANPWAGTVWAYLYQLKAANPGVATQIDAWASSHNITASGNNLWGSTETHIPTAAAGAPAIVAADVLPPYTVVTPGTPLNICSAGTLGAFNKVSNSRLLRLPASANALALTALGASSSVPHMRVNGYPYVSYGHNTTTATAITSTNSEVVAAVGDCGVVDSQFGTTALSTCKEPATPPAEQCWTMTLQ